MDCILFLTLVLLLCSCVMLLCNIVVVMQTSRSSELDGARRQSQYRHHDEPQRYQCFKNHQTSCLQQGHTRERYRPHETQHHTQNVV